MNEESIASAMLWDQYWLRKQARKLEDLQKHAKPFEEVRARLEDRLSKSVARREMRAQRIPPVSFDPELPIAAHHDEIVEAIHDHQVVVVAGETGSGKSTQLPKICLDAGFGIRGLIGHTQPRRIAARSVASRIAEELGMPLGTAVGYKVRFQDETSPETYIKLMTDGMLLAEAASDRFLEQYEVIILDEAHERSLNIDFLLGILHRLLRKRPELRLVITSATIDAERFGEHFGTSAQPAPVITVEGRTYPVEVRYRGLEDESGQTLGTYQGVLRAFHELSDEGDVLVFLPTERDIRETAKRLRADKVVQRQQREVLPLYARLSTADQNKIFHPGKARRIVLATNVAESSLTVPRIHCVIDTGTARISRYSPRLRMQRLPIESISQASAEQRKGRCGRLGPGTCVRLFDEEDFHARSPFTTPEIRRTNLASVILQAKYLRLGEVDTIPFLDPPRPETIREGYKTLFELGAVDERRRLTDLGSTLARLPVDPRIGRMVLAASDENCLAEILIVAAALEIQDPRVRPIDRQQAADEQHQQFVDEDSDFLSYLKLWDFVQTKRGELSRGGFRRLCEKTFLSPNRLHEWFEVHRQLKQTAADIGLKPQRRRDDSPAIHRALLTGLLSCAAYRAEENQYTGAGGNKLFLWPGSGLFRSKPKWVMAAELVETTKRFGRTAARINPAWLESLGAHVTKQSYSDPHWHAKSQSVMAFESVTLYGLPIVNRRRVAYGHLDVEVARQIFIERGLVGQQMEVSDKFFQHNAKVCAEAEKLAAKTRRRDCILDEFRLHAFYEQRIPRDVYDMASLRRKFKSDPKLRTSLEMSIEDLVGDDLGVDTKSFPTEIDVGSMKLPLTYHFEPGAENDGVTLTVPPEAVSQLHSAQLEWLVPGLLEEKLVALIRSLPKPMRRGLVPAPDTAKKVADELEFGATAFLPEVARRLSEIAGDKISPANFRLSKLPPHLQMRVRVVGHDGDEQMASRDIIGLRSELASGPDHVTSTAATPDDPWYRDGVKSWDFGDLPAETRVIRGGIEVVLFPALVEFEDGTLGLRLEETRTAAEISTRHAACRLFRELNRRAIRSQVRNLPQWSDVCLWSASLFPKDHLEEQVGLLIAEMAFLHGQPALRLQDDFEARQSESGQRIAIGTQSVAALAPKMMSAYHRAQLALGDITAERYAAIRTDVQNQLAELMHANCLAQTPWNWLVEFPRYLDGITYRLERLNAIDVKKEETLVRELNELWSRLDRCDQRVASIAHAELVTYRWMIEEYRVSLFAQPLGTAVKVSRQRLEKQWEKTRA